MGIDLMGKVVVQVKIENIDDLVLAKRGLIPHSEVRAIEVDDAVVDTGASTLLLPSRWIRKLGLTQHRVRPAKGLGGPLMIPMYQAVRLTIQDRDCVLDVGEISDEFPVLIGQIPLEMLDWVVDLKNQRLIGNPDHGGEFGLDAF